VAVVRRALDAVTEREGLILETCADVRLCLDKLRRAQTGEVAGVALGPSIQVPAMALRELGRQHPHLQFLVLSFPERLAAVQRQLATAPLLARQWSVVALNDARLPEAVAASVRLNRQRQDLRTTLDRMNQRLTVKAPPDPGEHRRLFVSDRYLSVILTHAPEAIIAVAADGRITLWNHGAALMFGLSDHEAIGRPLATLADVRSKESLASIVAQVANRTSLKFQNQCRHADGRRLEVEWTVTRVPDEDGSLLGISAIARDITEQVRSERRRHTQYRVSQILAEAQAHDSVYRDILAAAGETLEWDCGIAWECAAPSGRLQWSADWVADTSAAPMAAFLAAKKDTGFARGEGLPGSVWAQKRPLWVGDMTQAENFPRKASALAAGLLSGFAFPVLVDDELHAVLEFFSTERREPDADLLLMVASVGRQVGQFLRRKASERQLFEEHQRLLVTLTSIGDGVITTDTDGRVVLLNRVAEELTGWRNDEAIGQPLPAVFNIVNETTRAPCENPADKVLRTGLIVGLANHTALIAKDGRERRIADSGAPIRDPEGKVLGVVLVFRDVTEQQRMEEELAKAQKLESLGVLAGGIAHDFNNILTAVLGNISLARLITQQQRESQEVLAEAERACTRARELTQQLLTFSQGGAPIKRLASLADLLRETVGFALRGANVFAEFALAPDLWPAEVDTGQIGQVFHNLVLNARQAMPQGGTLKIAADNMQLDGTTSLPLAPGPYVRLQVRDTGIGIAPEHLSRIFDPFFTTKQRGSGLGLATSYSIVKRHDGHIAAESTVDVGTTLSVWLPARPGLRPRTAAPAKPLRGGGGRVLLMDDEASVRQVGASLLQALGYAVETVADGDEALRAYEAARHAGRPFDIVMLDLTVVRGMGGRECIGRLRALDPAVKAVVSSGYSNDPVMADYAAFGFAGVVPKPYELGELGETLERILRAEAKPPH